MRSVDIFVKLCSHWAK